MKRVLLFLLAFILLISSASAEVIISEIMYDLNGSDTGREWIEIYSADEANLSGWKFYEAETNHRLNLTKGSETFTGYAVIADNVNNFLSDNPDFDGVLFDSSFSLKNDNETIALKNSTLNITFEITYSSEWGGNGNGRSIQFADDEWCEGIPTPGEENECQESIEENTAENDTQINQTQQPDNETAQENQTQANSTENTLAEDKEGTAAKKAADEKTFSEYIKSNASSNTSKNSSSNESAKKVIYQSKNDKMKEASIYLLGGLLLILVIYLIKQKI